MINWYPGHMAKAQQKLKERLQVIDVVIELLDARIPFSSRNPQLEELLEEQRRIIVLNKMDLADYETTKDWVAKLEQEAPTIAVNSLRGQRVSLILNRAQEMMVEEQEKLAAQGRRQKNIRLMIVGVPNVGKSQLINQLCNSGSARTGDTPGVTRGQQWVKLREGFELLDTPGVLWPKQDDEEVAFKLAATGAIKEGSYDQETVAYKLLKILEERAAAQLQERYKLDWLPTHTLELMEEIGRKRGCLMSGGKIDRQRTAEIILKDFRGGQLGRITLETPKEVSEDEDSRTDY
ncbi:ribosome biogenesis GTPase YlqF [Fuchsiella alkaliacetigena]|uniref:ribosome biogenesis GTPase YlqF n=1 Tax=Fuchsiella alkaliacetigena TaxID=957042 RepID=UPI00200B4109|nr:ribosome biogenesis GTPase YlqF [Fuchsiella alkaliacetigena]MCK8825642.1 ribosome biogenesis GTPase YlqF [Fuchsiella alkaliacetigena]